MLIFVLLDLFDGNTILFEGSLKATNGPFGLKVVLDNVTLQTVYRAPVDARAPIMITPQVHLDCRASWVVLCSSNSVRCPDTTIQSVDSLTVVMSIGKGLRHLVRMSRGRSTLTSIGRSCS